MFTFLRAADSWLGLVQLRASLLSPDTKSIQRQSQKRMSEWENQSNGGGFPNRLGTHSGLGTGFLAQRYTPTNLVSKAAEDARTAVQMSAISQRRVLRRPKAL